jgi:hypothetical protein
MPKIIMKTILLILTLVLLQGCTSIARITYEFENKDRVPSILYDQEAEDIATKVEDTLDENIASVVNNLYQEFKDINAIKIYIFESKDRYSSFSGSTPRARGSAVKNEVYISPIIRERIETLDAIVIHELSHVHLRQYIGTWRYMTEVPGWFHEGLAVEVSGGGGAEKVSSTEALAAIKLGNHFVPREKSGLLGHKYASSYGLEPQMYYRQSNVFVRYLMDKDPDAFKKVYLSLIQGVSFKEVWALEYGKGVTELWQEFVEQIKA